MLKASAPVGTLCPDRGTLSLMSALKGSCQGAGGDSMTPNQGCFGWGGGAVLPLACQIRADR